MTSNLPNDDSQLAADVTALRDALHDELGRIKPVPNSGALVALCGLPGTGKSHFAAALASRIPCLVLGSDRLRKILKPQPRYTREEHARVFRAAHTLLESLLAQGHRVVFDATNLTDRARDPLRDIAARVNVPLLLVQFDAPPTIVRQRLARRSRGEIDDTWSDADWRIYCRLYPGHEPLTGPHLFVDSSQSIEPALEEMVKLLERDNSPISYPEGSG